MIKGAVVEETKIIAPDNALCIEMKQKYDMIPGKSFGTLPTSRHKEYLRLKCYKFFCKPHPMAGRGVFDCEPIE